MRSKLNSRLGIRTAAATALALSSPSALADLCEIQPTTACPLYKTAGPKQPDVTSYRNRNKPTGRAISFGNQFMGEDRFNFYNYEIGNTVQSCNIPAATLRVPCPDPTWQASFVKSPTTGAVKALVAIWSDTAAGWSSTKVYRDAGQNGRGAQIATSSSLPGGYPAGISSPTAIPGGPSFGGYFLIDVPVGTTDTTGFTYRSSLPNQIKFSVQTQVNTNAGSVLATDSGVTNFKPAIGFTTTPISATAGECSGPMTVSTLDGDGNIVNTLGSNPAQIRLHAAPANTFLDAACNYPTDKMAIMNPVPAPPAGQRPPEVISTQKISFYLKTNSIYSNFPVTTDYVDTDGTTILVATQNQAVQANAPVSIRATGPGSVPQKACSSAITITFSDKFGNESRLTGARQLSLVGVGSSQFFTNPACSGAPSGQLAVGAGTSSLKIYFLDPSPSLVKVRISDSAGTLQGAEHPIRILANGLLARAADLPHATNMARTLFRRLTGVPILDSDPRLASMSDLILKGKVLDAASIATKDSNFLDIKMKGFFVPLSNRAQESSEPLSDFVATGIGIVRDNIDARSMMTGNQIYVGKSLATPNNSTCANATVYKSNAHYLDLESRHVSLASELVPVRQCAYNTTDFSNDQPIPTGDFGGLLTTHKWGEQHVVAGTNRRAFEYALKEFNCLTMTDISDNSLPDGHIRRDVARQPGGDPNTYKNSCVSCHAIMDQAAGAFAFHDWYPRPQNQGGGDDARLFWISTGGYGADSVMPKMNINQATFPSGWSTGDNSWSLNLSEKQQKLIGIDEGIATSGAGVNSLGQALSNSKSFRGCMAKRAFKAMCLRDPGEEDQSSVDDLANYFADTGYNLRNLFERSAALGQCLGGGGTL